MNETEDKQLEEIKKMILKKILSKNAFERLGRIKLVKPETANQLELYLIQLYQQNKIKREISDEELKLILESLISKKEFKIIK
ncbi:MAG: DNA-binding protein [Candidatus Aenigmatarchaeota archaeon]